MGSCYSVEYISDLLLLLSRESPEHHIFKLLPLAASRYLVTQLAASSVFHIY